ncbi:putative 2-oxo-4-hydroxy-4-carboxy-5-ureidoimidazoline decarboxylase [Ptychodera flava]|uniref:putative 2-oxo-4-hydroxy-4-carboxy-5-ureidoimidazoline decarboxylase n=1 Tax=Ptychodera flava TaxID=63121 RepID=UPI00396A9EE6
MSSRAKLDVGQLNDLTFDEFFQRFQNIIEYGSLITASIWSHRPFRSAKHLHDHFCAFIDGLADDGKTGILLCHPDLAGKLSQAGKLTEESTKEQKGSGLLSLTDEERAFLQDCNEQYRKKFGFPFVICARENKKAAIMEGFNRRLKNTHSEELDTGIAEVKKIGWYRLTDLIEAESKL